MFGKRGRRVRRLFLKEWAACSALGALLGVLCRPQVANVAGEPPTAWELRMAVACVVGGVVFVTGLYGLLVWRKGW